jgi:MEMO1 family protein
VTIARDPFGPADLDTSPLAASDRAFLLDIARRAVGAAVVGPAHRHVAGSVPRAAAIPARLAVPGRAFVTITVDGDLAGCIGILARDTALADAVEQAATSAATRDPRFAPLTPAELRRAHLEVSVLGEFRPLPSVEAFRPGTDGILVVRGGRRGLLLPDVATEMGWGTPEMLAGGCAKAGLPSDAWRDPGTELFVFETQHFGGDAVAQVRRPASEDGPDRS